MREGGGEGEVEVEGRERGGKGYTGASIKNPKLSPLYIPVKEIRTSPN